MELKINFYEYVVLSSGIKEILGWYVDYLGWILEDGMWVVLNRFVVFILVGGFKFFVVCMGVK